MQGPRDEIVANKLMGRRLVKSAKNGSFNVVEELLHNGASVNFQDGQVHVNLLHLNSKTGHF